MSIRSLQLMLEDTVEVTLIVVCPKCGAEHDTSDPDLECPTISEIKSRVDINTLIEESSIETTPADPSDDRLTPASPIVDEPFVKKDYTDLSTETPEWFDETLAATVEEFEDAIKTIDDVEDMSVIQTTMESYISNGERAKAEICAVKLYETMDRIAARHGIVNKPVMSVQLESLSDQTWLDYMQEEVSEGMEILIRVLIAVLTKVAVGLVMWLGYVFVQAVKDRRAKAAALKEIPVGDLETMAEALRESNLKYTPVFNWDHRQYYSPTDYVRALEHLQSSVLPVVAEHLGIVDRTIDIDRHYITRSVLEWLTEAGGREVNKEDSERASRKWVEEATNQAQSAARVIAPHAGIYLGGLLIAPDHKTKQRLLHSVKGVAEDYSIDAAMREVVGSENIIFSPYYFIRERKDLVESKTLPIKAAAKANSMDLKEMLDLARKEMEITGSIFSKLEGLKNNNSNAIKLLESELKKLDDVLKSRKLKGARVLRMNELKASVHNAKNNLTVIRNTFMSFGRLFYSSGRQEGFHF